MKGRNVLMVNDEQMILIVQDWINKTLVTPVSVVDVMFVSNTNTYEIDLGGDDS